jgi:hypothetical protein
MGRTPTVVIGTAQAAWDILEKKSPVTSSRPRFIMVRHFIFNPEPAKSTPRDKRF